MFVIEYSQLQECLSWKFNIFLNKSVSIWEKITTDILQVILENTFITVIT